MAYMECSFITLLYLYINIHASIAAPPTLYHLAFSYFFRVLSKAEINPRAQLDNLTLSVLVYRGKLNLNEKYKRVIRVHMFTY